MMNIDIPLTALRPFLSSPLRVYAETGRYQYAAPFEVKGCALQTDPYTLQENNGESWAVSFAVEDLGGRTILPGAKIEGDGIPLLFVGSVHRNGALVICDCSAKKKPQGQG